jgi:hypothetical protein
MPKKNLTIVRLKELAKHHQKVMEMLGSREELTLDRSTRAMVNQAKDAFIEEAIQLIERLQ